MENNVLAKKYTPSDIMRFALPNIFMMIFMSLYTVVDGIFISRYASELALSATNIFYPVMSLQYAAGIMLSTGGSAIIAWKLGRNENQEAKEDFTSIVLVAIIIGALFTIVCIPLLKPILNLLGASSAQMPDCTAYAKTILWFSPMMFLQTVFQSFFVTTGKPTLGLGLIVSGGIANMVFDYLFMAHFKMGIAGAALATGIGYCIPAVAGLLFFAADREGALYFTRINFRPNVLFRACVNGSSEMVSNIAAAVTTFLFNVIFMRFWAENGVAAITMLSYYQFIFSAVFIGFSMGVSPIISFKYGSDDREQLKSIIKFSLKFIALTSVAIYIISIFTVDFALVVFTDKGSPVYNIAKEGFAIYAIQFIFMGISIFTSAMFTAFNNGIVSGAVSIARTFIFLAGSLIILPSLFGKTGVWFAVPTAELLGLVVSVSFLIWGRKKYHY